MTVSIMQTGNGEWKLKMGTKNGNESKPYFGWKSFALPQNSVLNTHRSIFM